MEVEIADVIEDEVECCVVHTVVLVTIGAAAGDITQVATGIAVAGGWEVGSPGGW